MLFGGTSVELELETLLLDVVVLSVVLITVNTEEVEGMAELEATELTTVDVGTFGVVIAEDDEVGGTHGVVVFVTVSVLVVIVLAGGVCEDFGVATDEEEPVSVATEAEDEEDITLVVGTGVLGDTSEERDDTIEVMIVVTGTFGVVTSVDEDEMGRLVLGAVVFWLTIEDIEDTIELMMLVTGTVGVDRSVELVELVTVVFGIERRVEEAVRVLLLLVESLGVATEEEEVGAREVVGTVVFGEIIEEMEDTMELMTVVAGSVGVVKSDELEELVLDVERGVEIPEEDVEDAVGALEVATDEDEDEDKLVVGSGVLGLAIEESDDTMELMMLVAGIVGVVRRAEEFEELVRVVFGVERRLEELVGGAGSVEELVTVVFRVERRVDELAIVVAVVFGLMSEVRVDTIELKILVAGTDGVDRRLEELATEVGVVLGVERKVELVLTTEEVIIVVLSVERRLELLLGRTLEVEGSFGVVSEEELLGLGLVATEEILLGSTMEVELEETLDVVATEDEEVGASEELLLGSTIEVEETFVVVATGEDEEVGSSVVDETEVLLKLLETDVGSCVVVELESGAVEDVVGFPVNMLLVVMGRATPAEEEAAQFIGASLFNCS